MLWKKTAILPAVLLLCAATLLSGCKDSKIGAEIGKSIVGTKSAGEYTYAIKELALPEGIEELGFYTFTEGENLYFPAFFPDKSAIIAVEPVSGAVTELYTGENYVGGSFFLDSAGKLWTLIIDETPTLNSEGERIGISDVEYTVSCIDTSNGTLENSYDLSFLTEDGLYAPESIFLDAEGFLNVHCSGKNQRDGFLAILDISGETLKEVCQLNTGRLVQMSTTASGQIMAGWQTPEGYVLHIAEPQTEQWGQSWNPEVNLQHIAPGTGEHMYLADSSNVYDFDIETGEMTKLFDWLSLGLGAARICCETSDGQILVMALNTDETGKSARNSLILLVRKEASMNSVTTLTLATTDSFLIRDRILEFNRKNADIKINLLDYSIYNTGETDSSAITRMTAELISGNYPDIFLLDGLPAEQYMAKGLLEDLYPYIDEDPDINREDFQEQIFSASEYENGLYMIFPSYNISTVLGKSEYVGKGGTWSLDDFRALVKKNPYVPVFGKDITREGILQYIIGANGGAFVDWENGSCSFDSDEFINLLSFVGLIEENRSEGGDEAADVASGEQLLSVTVLNSVILSPHLRSFGDSLACVGFPADSGGGNAIVPEASLGISSMSENKQAAWRFVREFLLDDYQDNNVTGFPIKNSALDKQFDQHREMYPAGESVAFATEAGTREVKNDPEADVQFIKSLIDSATQIQSTDQTLNQIISDEASAFFAGDKTAEETARLIQSRAKLYISEQM